MSTANDPKKALTFPGLNLVYLFQKIKIVIILLFYLLNMVSLYLKQIFNSIYFYSSSLNKKIYYSTVCSTLHNWESQCHYCVKYVYQWERPFALVVWYNLQWLLLAYKHAQVSEQTNLPNRSFIWHRPNKFMVLLPK